MSNFDFAARPHYLARFSSPGAPWLRAGKHLETLSDLKALEEDFKSRELELSNELRVAAFSVPYIGVTMRRGIVFVCGLAAAVCTLVYILYQALGLTATAQQAVQSPHFDPAHARAVIVDTLRGGYALSASMRGFVASTAASAGAAASRGSKLRSLVLSGALWVAMTADVAILLTFMAIPLFYAYFEHVLLKEQSLDYLNGLGWFCLRALVIVHIGMVFMAGATVMTVGYILRRF